LSQLVSLLILLWAETFPRERRPLSCCPDQLAAAASRLGQMGVMVDLSPPQPSGANYPAGAAPTGGLREWNVVLVMCALCCDHHRSISPRLPAAGISTTRVLGQTTMA
jgi:hypothetical protein